MRYPQLNLKALLFAAVIFLEVRSSIGAQFSLSVEVFLDESKADLVKIAQSVAKRFQSDRKKAISEPKSIDVDFTLQRYNDSVASILNLNQQIYSNVSSSFLAAVFVDISSHSLFLSSVMDKSNISTVGLFRTSGVSTTQENHAAFTRVTRPSVQHYARAVRDMLRKMGWRTLRLVLSADYESKVLADAIFEFSRREKWRMLQTAWLLGDESAAELETIMKQILSNVSDVAFVHINGRGNYNEDFFRLAKMLGVNKKKTAWLLTDVTTQGVSNTTVLPVGVIKLAPRERIQPDFVGNALYDAFSLLESSFESSVKLAQDSGGLDNYPRDSQDSCLTFLAKERTKTTFFRGKTSLFTDPSLPEGPFPTTDIFTLSQDLRGINFWSPIGLKTHSGIALETFKAPNGDVMSPPLENPRPVIRVPIVLYSPWIEAEEPEEIYGSETTCLKRGYVCYNRTAAKNTRLCCFGLSIDLLRILERELGFIPDIYFAPDEQYGMLNEKTGHWNGMVNELISGRGDLALDMALTEQRAKVIDFSFPYIPLALNILVQKEGKFKKGVEWDSWLKPFDVSLWLALLGACNIILLVIWWLDRKSPTGYYHYLKESEEDGFTLLDAMSYVWGVAFSKDIGAEKTPRSVSARCVSTVYAFMALIIVNTYCANLMAFLVQEDAVLPITGITDPKIRDPTLHPPDGFKLGVLQGSFVETYFKNHTNPDFRQIYHNNLKINLMNSFDDGIQKLMNSEIQGLVGDYLSLRQAGTKDHNCTCAMAGSNFYTYGLGFALPKNSPWVQDITRVVLEMKANGSIDSLENTYFDKTPCQSSVAQDLSIMNFSGLFVAVAVTIVFCFLALLAEMTSIFVLVRFGQHLGALGKFSVRLLFDLKKGEEHLITLKNDTNPMTHRRHACVQLNLVKLTSGSQDNNGVGVTHTNVFVTSTFSEFQNGQAATVQDRSVIRDICFRKDALEHHDSYGLGEEPSFRRGSGSFSIIPNVTHL